MTRRWDEKGSTRPLEVTLESNLKYILPKEDFGAGNYIVSRFYEPFRCQCILWAINK